MKNINEEDSITVSKQWKEKVIDNDIKLNDDQKEEFSKYINFILNKKITTKD